MLAVGEVGKAEVCRDAQKKFINDYIGRWLKPFSIRLRRCSRVAVYPALADLTHEFVAYHAGRLGVQLKPHEVEETCV